MSRAGRPRKVGFYRSNLGSILMVYDELRRSPSSVKFLSERFELHRRTIYRYLRIYEQMGYNLVCDGKDRYQIKTDDRNEDLHEMHITSPVERVQCA